MGSRELLAAVDLRGAVLAVAMVWLVPNRRIEGTLHRGA